MKFFITSLMAALAVSAGVSAHEHIRARGHANVNIKHFLGSGQEAAANQTQLAKRFEGGHFTYFATGLGACGQVNVPSDFIVALNSAQFSGGANCFKTITITINGKSAQASIADECPGCGYGGLDFTQGLFEYFAPTSVGVLSGSWVFGSGEQPTTSKPAPTPTPTPTPTSTSSPEPTPTSTSTWSPPPSSSAAPTPSSTSTSSSSSSSSSVWTESSSSVVPSSTSEVVASASSSAPPTSSLAAPEPTGVLSEANQVMLAFAKMAAAGSEM